MLVAPHCPADIIVTIPNVSVASGGSGFLDVLVSGSAMDGFQYFTLDFRVAGVAQAADPINFVRSVTPAPQLAATAPDYIFLGDSLEEDLMLGIDFVGPPTADDLITVSDESFSGDDKTLNDTFLLARLNFVAPLSATPRNVYDVFLDFGIFEDTSSAFPAFSSNVGSITINAAAVPEPSSIALLAIGSVAWFCRRRRGRIESRTRQTTGIQLPLTQRR